MEQIWSFSNNAVTVAAVDFLDPAVAHEPHARERGVRLEVRPVRWQLAGSIYASPALHLAPAVVRVDLLESSPHAADKMHWHPGMRDGEPGDRVFDRALAEGARRWLASFLAGLRDGALDGLEPDAATSLRSDGQAIAAAADTIVDRAMRILDEVRGPWPDVTHDERGLAVS
jgi:hypothetical protein